MGPLTEKRPRGGAGGALWSPPPALARRGFSASSASSVTQTSVDKVQLSHAPGVLTPTPAPPPQ